jgi:hypothetical protein
MVLRRGIDGLTPKRLYDNHYASDKWKHGAENVMLFQVLRDGVKIAINSERF